MIVLITYNRLPLIRERQLRIGTRIGLQRDALSRLDRDLRRDLYLQPFMHLDQKCHFLGRNAIRYFAAMGATFCHILYTQYRLRTDAVSIRDPFLAILDTFSPLVSYLLGNGRSRRDFHLQLVTKCYQQIALPVIHRDLKRAHRALQRITSLSGIIPVRNDAEVLPVRIQLWILNHTVRAVRRPRNRFVNPCAILIRLSEHPPPIGQWTIVGLRILMQRNGLSRRKYPDINGCRFRIIQSTVHGNLEAHFLCLTAVAYSTHKGLIFLYILNCIAAVIRAFNRLQFPAIFLCIQYPARPLIGKLALI